MISPVEGFALAASVLAVVGAVAALVGLRRIPEAPEIKTLCLALMEEVEAVKSALSSVRRDFRTLEEDVEAHLEQASTRAQRARARETNEKRRAKSANGAAQALPGMGEPTDLEAAFQAAEAALWNDR